MSPKEKKKEGKRTKPEPHLWIPPAPPLFAYLIFGSAAAAAADQIKRVLRAAYDPLNSYQVHLDLGSGAEERADLRRFVGSERVFGVFGNVRVLEDADPVMSKGRTEVAMLLHAVAVLLKEGKDWSWFINLSASDYPLVPQDGTIPAKVILQLTTAFREGGLRNRAGDFCYKDHLHKCDVPVLSLAADEDLICPPDAVYDTVKLFPEDICTYKIFGKPGGPHYGHYDLVGGRMTVDEVYPSIIKFLSNHDKLSSY